MKHAADSPAPSGMPVSRAAADLFDRSVLLVTGKGGVGKSTVAATLARLAARRGRRVLLVEIEPVSRAAPLFGLTRLGPEPVQVDRGLSVLALDSADSLRFFFTQQLRIPALVQLALRNKAVQGFFRSMPAIKSILFLYRLWRLEADHGRAGDGTYDLIICDLPTSGFVVGMYAIPRSLSQIFRFGPLGAYAAGMQELLVDPKRSGVVLVTLPEEMPVVETLELRKTLRDRFDVSVAAIVLNGVYPEVLDPDDAAAMASALAAPAEVNGVPGDPDAGARPAVEPPGTLDGWLWAARLLGSRHRRAAEVLPRLRSEGGAVVELPFLFRRELPLEAIDQLAHRLAAALGGAA